ncbi:MAG: hypothetical protein J5552_00835 [Prevotella sp.]|nr:hypothetical protein [Prevotella sp.]
MKRIVFALCAIFVFLGTMAQGNIEKRLQGNPKIDSLVNKVVAMGVSPDVSYSFDGKLHHTVSIQCIRMNDFQPTAPTGIARVDSMNHIGDSLRQQQAERWDRAYDAIRNTCKSLIDDAKESYVWEYHRNGVDSVRYALAIGEYQPGNAMTTYQHNREVYYNNAPELISFYYNTNPSNDGSKWNFKGFGNFRYEYTPDSVFRPKNETVPLDKVAFSQLLQPILSQKGITSREFYAYHDSTYTFDKLDFGKDVFVVRVNTLDPIQPKNETRGTVYTMHSKAQADEVLNQIKTATLTFLENNPGIWFSYHPYADYGYKKLYKLLQSEYMTRVPDFYQIYLHSVVEKKEFNIIIVEGTGDMMIPAEWAVVKSWKNGKATYDKRAMKYLTPQQAREKSSGRSITTRQFEPID